MGFVAALAVANLYLFGLGNINILTQCPMVAAELGIIHRFIDSEIHGSHYCRASEREGEDIAKERKLLAERRNSAFLYSPLLAVTVAFAILLLPFLSTILPCFTFAFPIVSSKVNAMHGYTLTQRPALHYIKTEPGHGHGPLKLTGYVTGTG